MAFILADFDTKAADGSTGWQFALGGYASLGIDLFITKNFVLNAEGRGTLATQIDVVQSFNQVPINGGGTVFVTTLLSPKFQT